MHIKFNGKRQKSDKRKANKKKYFSCWWLDSLLSGCGNLESQNSWHSEAPKFFPGRGVSKSWIISAHTGKNTTRPQINAGYRQRSKGSST